jgi:hypothetical protein
MRASELRYSPLLEVAREVDLFAMDTDQLRGVILNLIDHIAALEKMAHTHAPEKASTP